MVQYYPILGSIMVSSPDGLVEEMLGGIGEEESTPGFGVLVSVSAIGLASISFRKK